MQTYNVNWILYGVPDYSSTATVNAASEKNALRMLARDIHPGATLTFRDGGASTSRLILSFGSVES